MKRRTHPEVWKHCLDEVGMDERGVMRHPRKDGKIYYFPATRDREAVVIFDAGNEGGNVHVYEHAQTLPASRLNEVLAKYGHNIAWRLVSEGVDIPEGIVAGYKASTRTLAETLRKQDEMREADD